MGLMLAIETSNPSGAAADAQGRSPGGVAGAGVAAVERPGPAAQPRVLGVERVIPDRGDDLTPAIDRLFRRLAIEPTRIDDVAVSVGPGGFTSVRIAVMSAKMIAMVAGARCYAVPTALALARRAGAEAAGAPHLSVVLAWKREDAWVARFRRAAGTPGWTPMGPWGAEPLPSIAERASEGAMVAEPRLVAMLREGGGLAASTVVLPPVFDPVAIAEAAGELDPIAPDELLPLYPREPEAVTKWRALHRRG